MASPLPRVASSELSPMPPAFAFSCLQSFPHEVYFAFGYHSRLSRLLLYLEHHIHESVSLSKAADIACMERTAFCKFFRRATGINYTRFLHAFRIHRAAILLVSHDLSITQVADGVGYQSTAVFERHFKQHFGMTPREYRADAMSGRLPQDFHSAGQ